MSVRVGSEGVGVQYLLILKLGQSMLILNIGQSMSILQEVSAC